MHCMCIEFVVSHTHTHTHTHTRARIYIYIYIYMDFVLSFRYHVFNAREWSVLAETCSMC